jgi:hypothetical protein
VRKRALAACLPHGRFGERTPQIYFEFRETEMPQRPFGRRRQRP